MRDGKTCARSVCSGLSPSSAWISENLISDGKLRYCSACGVIALPDSESLQQPRHVCRGDAATGGEWVEAKPDAERILLLPALQGPENRYVPFYALR